MASSDNSNFFKNINLLVEKKHEKNLPVKESNRLPTEPDVTTEAIEKRLTILQGKSDKNFPFLSGNSTFNDFNQLEGNIENFIGMTMVPTGIIGLLKVKGTSATGDFFGPLATSEGALIASFHGGAKACYKAGGATSFCIEEGICVYF